MGAPSSLKWIPEDDRLLRNAVEAGASLESLAKGAVCFSRRFTIQELKERWRSVLYDLDTSSEVSAAIIAIDIELSASNSLNVSNPAKSSRNCNPKGQVFSFGKRKDDSIRNHYYAMKKRLRKPCTSANILAFSSCPDTSSAYVDDFQLKSQNEHHCSSSAVGEPISNHSRHLGMTYDTEGNVFQDLLRVGSAVATDNFSHHVYHKGHGGSLEEGSQDGIVESDCLYGYTENVSLVSTENAGRNNTEKSLHHDHVQRGFQRIHGEHVVSHKVCSDVQEIIPLQTFHRGNLYENDNVEVKPVSANVNHENCSNGLVTNHHITSQAAEGIDSFHHLGYSSAPYGLPIWKEDVPGPDMTMDVQFENNEQGVVSADDLQRIDSSGCGGASSDPKLNDEMRSGGLNNETVGSEGDFMDFSSSYMEFGDDAELLFMDVEEKDIADKSCLGGLNPILLDSPSDTHQDDLLKSSDPRGTEVLNTSFVVSDTACSVESYNARDEIQSAHVYNSIFCVSETKVPSPSSKITHTAEPLIFCTLNTEDPEVPSNDGVNLFPSTQLLLSFPSPDLEQTPKENAAASSSPKVLSNDRQGNVRELIAVVEEQVAQPLISSLEAGLSTSQKAGSRDSSGSCRVKPEKSENNPLAGFSADAAIAVISPYLCTSETVALQPASLAVPTEEKTLDLENHGKCNASISSFKEKSVQASDNAELCLVNMHNDCKYDPAKQVTMQKHVSVHVQMAAGDMGCSDPAESLLTLDQKEQHSDNENDMPNFSDIESMILDMDLGPYDQESSYATKEVSRYQSKNAKVIMRLEQGASSQLNRLISSRGAFAIFYGRRLKYFVKESKVSLGRATADLEVDIDLGREGCTTKISRLQVPLRRIPIPNNFCSLSVMHLFDQFVLQDLVRMVEVSATVVAVMKIEGIIKLEDNGAFILRNIGKCSIFVNGNEILSKKRTNLVSGSLIEIRTMKFLFHVNECATRRYITTQRGRCQGHNTQFDWKST